jgi:hypothetical protein
MTPRSLADVQRDLAEARSRLAGQRAVVAQTEADLHAARADDRKAGAALGAARQARTAIERSCAPTASDEMIENLTRADARERVAKMQADASGRKAIGASANHETASGAVARVEKEIAALELEAQEHPETIGAKLRPLVTRLVAAVEEIATLLPLLRAERERLSATHEGKRCGEHHVLLHGVETILSARGIVPEDVERSQLLEALSPSVLVRNPFAAVVAIARVLARKPCPYPTVLADYRRNVAFRGMYHSAADALIAARGPFDPRSVLSPYSEKDEERMSAEIADINRDSARRFGETTASRLARIVRRVVGAEDKGEAAE